jgi:hypothetical protein
MPYKKQYGKNCKEIMPGLCQIKEAIQELMSQISPMIYYIIYASSYLLIGSSRVFLTSSGRAARLS